ncbi:MAG: D-aminoacyl-tRNA deacylase [Brevinema sp.]
MKVVVRRVLSASVEVDQRIVSSINQGLLLYIGFAKGDTKEMCEYAVKKIVGLRIFEGHNAEVSVQDIKGHILSISQFTLSADIKKGFRPSYHLAMPSEEAIAFYEYTNQLLKTVSGLDVQTGIFGADMKIQAIDDGPFTILIEI